MKMRVGCQRLHSIQRLRVEIIGFDHGQQNGDGTTMSAEEQQKQLIQLIKQFISNPLPASV